MTSVSSTGDAAPKEERIFGIPLGGFGPIASLLLSLALGFSAFFAATFLAIFSLLIYNQSGQHHVDYADTYKLIGLPVGVGVLALSLAFFGVLWIRRKVAGR